MFLKKIFSKKNRIKVELTFMFGSIPFLKNNEIREDINRKMENKFIKLSFIPVKGMLIDLYDFGHIYNFNNNTMYWLIDCNNLYEIKEVIIKSDCLQILFHND